MCSLKIRPKKYLGQHFLIDKNIAKKIVCSLSFKGYSSVVEVGPGIGMLTQYLLKIKTLELFLIEIDVEAVNYLRKEFPLLKDHIIHADFLKWEPSITSFALIGNFPYNISSQILFRLLRYRNSVPECIGMFQKDMAHRIVGKHGSKIYGIISVLVQAFYEVEYLFTVNEKVFFPIPKVKSAIVIFRRKLSSLERKDESIFLKIVKSGFNHRRKILRNSLKPLSLSKSFYTMPILDKRAEELSVDEFINLSKSARDFSEHIAIL
ncbi:MAG: 16S rRNA (adenine(1518)-N(6)/adenine(1519)-N(6))-dimethyltransferase RsmA [Candidatus Walczuchella monophlebidarum]